MGHKSVAPTIYNSLVKILPIISKHPSRQVGCGLQVHLEIDTLFGLEENFLLSHDLVEKLHCREFYVLKDVHLVSGNKIWFDSATLGFSGGLVMEWKSYISFYKSRKCHSLYKTWKFGMGLQQ